MRSSTLSAIGLALFVVGVLSAQSPLTAETVITLPRVGDPQLHPSGARVVYSVGTPSLETNKSATALWTVGFDGSGSSPVANGAGFSNARWSPDGSMLLGLKSVDGVPQVHVMKADGDGLRAVTTLSTGADAPVWSPDGTRILFMSEVWPGVKGDAAQKAKSAATDGSSALAFDDLMIRHWNFWRDGRRAQLFTVDVATGAVTQLTDDGFDNPPWSLGGPQAFAWSADGSTVWFTRGQDPKREAWSTDANLASVPSTGGPVKVWTASNPGYDGGPVPSPDGKRIAYRSQARDGYESDLWRVMILDTTTGVSRRVGKTLPDGVEELAWIGGSEKLAVAVQDAGSHAWFTLDVETDTIEAVHAGPNAYGLSLSTDGKRAALLHASLVQPPEVYAYDVAKASTRRLTTHTKATIAATEMPTRDQMTWKGAHGDTVHGFRVLPPGFKKEDKRPAVVFIHGGPQGAWMDGWSTRWNPAIYAAAGYVVFCPNPRGSTGYGPEFCEQISGDWGGAVFEDLMKGVDALIEEGGVDATRLGAAGGSYGGYMVNWILGHDHRFKALVSHAGVYNLESMYGTTEELWFTEWEFKGAPWEDRTLYEKWSPHRFASAFRTPTLVIHGELDYRVPVNQGLELFTALRRRGVDSRLVVYPDEGHWVLRPRNGARWNREVMGWFDRYLKR